MEESIEGAWWDERKENDDPVPVRRARVAG